MVVPYVFSLKFLNRKTLFILLAFALMLLAFGITAICLNGRAEAVAGDVGQKAHLCGGYR